MYVKTGRWAHGAYLIIAAISVLAVSLLPGLLAPTPAAAQVADSDNAILFLVDTSGSMSGTKLDEAKAALSQTVEQLGGTYDMGLRQFAGSCANPGSLLIPVGPVDKTEFTAAIVGLTAGGGTPTSAALNLAAAEVPPGGTIVLVADGDDQCGQLCETAEAIAAGGIEVTIHAVGVQVGGATAEVLRCTADATGGDYVDVSNPGDLGDILTGIATGNRVVNYAPKLLFHYQEKAFPMDPDDFIAGAELYWAADAGCGDGDAIDPSPSSRKLGTGVYQSFPVKAFDAGWTGWLPEFSVCEPDASRRTFQSNEFTRPFKDTTANQLTRPTGPNGYVLDQEEGFYLNYGGTANGSPVGTTLDAPVFYVERNDTIEYWFFYGSDPKSNQAGDGVLAHEGDWEHVAIKFDGSTPKSMTYYGHSCNSGPIPWGNVPKAEGTEHPLVYVAEGTHASYPQDDLDTSSYCDPSINIIESKTFDDVYIEGVTDVTDFRPGVSVEWETWNGIGVVDPATQCWHGFGGAWGDTAPVPFRDARTGPLGLPFNSSLNPAVAQPFAPADCTTAIGLVEEGPDSDLQQWLDTMKFRFVLSQFGKRFIFMLWSTPIVLGEATVDSSGVLDVELMVPPGTPPGIHRIVAYDAETGEIAYSTHIAVVIPEECAPSNRGQFASGDVDGDLVLDDCDPNPDDGDSADLDGDGIANGVDNCPTIPNADQATTNPERSIGAACDDRLGVNIVDTVPQPGYLDGPFCSYFVPTIVGTDGDDVITGTNKRDVIWAGDGDDEISGLAGNDIICGGDGDDVINGDNGSDQLFGGTGSDTIFGGNAADELHGGDGDDWLDGGNGKDSAKGDTGSDVLIGGNGKDVAVGETGDACEAEETEGC